MEAGDALERVEVPVAEAPHVGGEEDVVDGRVCQGLRQAGIKIALKFSNCHLSTFISHNFLFGDHVILLEVKSVVGHRHLAGLLQGLVVVPGAQAVLRKFKIKLFAGLVFPIFILRSFQTT